MAEPETTAAREPAKEAAHAEYSRRLEACRERAEHEDRIEAIVGNARFAVFVAGAVLTALALGASRIGVGWLGLPVIVFMALTVMHERARRAYSRAGRAAAYYEKGLARLDDHWIGAGEPGDRFLDPDHPYAPDLDLFGPGSLFERLCMARTRAGEETLAAWLRSPAAPDEICARQAAVQELRSRLNLREDLALLGMDVRAGVHPESLARWGTAPPMLVTRWPRLVAALLAALALGTLGGWLVLDIGPSPFLVVVLLEWGFAFRLRARVQRVTADVELAARDLALLAALLTRLEHEQFTAPRLQQLRAALDTEGMSPSLRIAQLVRLIDLLNSRKNQFFAPFGGLLLWSIQLAYAIEGWRKRSGPAVARWLSAVGELEALGSLAAYAYENPADPFPEILSAGPRFEGEGLGHPLIPEARCVRNDLVLGGELRVLIVSGSNMSGKSTLLRAVGANTVLALAGAPVRARRLRLSPLMVGATLRIQDSLQAGKSRFYAEITRVRQLVDLARGSPPLLFLLDEILHGTNSHDRRLGAEAVVRNLIALGAVGLVTTHDLALAHIVDLLGPKAANVHFEDHFDNGAIAFDYRMRPGVVQKSNALALMRAVGLEV